MARYGEELMEQMVRKMMPPHSRSVASISRESGISAPTLYAWKRRFQEQEYWFTQSGHESGHLHGCKLLA